MVTNAIFLTGLTKWAKTRIKEHGPLFRWIKTEGNQMLVESIKPSWRGETWKGWFVIDVEVIHSVPETLG